MAFGSVVLPLKALVMNVLSLSAAFGAVVWIFQEGHLSGLLGFSPTGDIEATQPILMLAMAFGLSMDYEVFLLSRIREEWDRTGDNPSAVANGLARTGPIITSAALLLIVVIGAFATSGITFIKMLGVGMVIAIVIDATVVRGLLVPATMRLLGAANWWAPAPLRRAWERYGFREGDGESGAPASDSPAGVPAIESAFPYVLSAPDPVYPTAGGFDPIAPEYAA
jgi:RND superfamily putative drug exporter